MRILIIVDAIYMLVFYKKSGKYKMTPAEIVNSQFPIVI